MSNLDPAIFIIFGAVLLFVVPFLFVHFMSYAKEIKFIKMELGRARDKNEYIHWKKELSYARWAIIPGLTTKRVKKLCRRHKKH